jgi:hypothetical protein
MCICVLPELLVVANPLEEPHGSEPLPLTVPVPLPVPAAPVEVLLAVSAKLSFGTCRGVAMLLTFQASWPGVCGMRDGVWSPRGVCAPRVCHIFAIEP